MSIAYLTDEAERVYWRVLDSLAPEHPSLVDPQEHAANVTSEVMRARGFRVENVKTRLAHLSQGKRTSRRRKGV